MKEKFCCNQLKAIRARGSNSNIVYTPYDRIYALKFKNNSGGMVIEYCPWCGEKLPEALDKEWYELVRDKQNDDGTWDFRKLPKEFRTDVWWRNRNL